MADPKKTLDTVVKAYQKLGEGLARAQAVQSAEAEEKKTVTTPPEKAEKPKTQ